MDKNYKIIIVLLSVAVIALAATVTLVIFYKSVEEEVVEEVEIKEKMHVYELSWSEQSINMSQDDIKNNMTKLPLFWDGKKFPHLIDGTCQFYLTFRIPKEFLKDVTISISWKDRFPLLGFVGRDVLYLDICTPDGGHESGIMEMPIFGFLSKVMAGYDIFGTYDWTYHLNECPPIMEIIANNSDEAENIYCKTHDILSYNRGYDGKWEITGQSYMGEIRLLRRARNLFRNLVLNPLLGDTLKVDVHYTYYTMGIIDLGEVEEYD